MFRISKSFAFSASHQLAGLPPMHPCSRLHGHNYVVEIELASERLDEVGFVFDYRAMDGFKRWVDEVLDHRHLNDVLGAGTNPTAELLAAFLFSRARELLGERVTAVAVCETDRTRAEYRPP